MSEADDLARREAEEQAQFVLANHLDHKKQTAGILRKLADTGCVGPRGKLNRSLWKAIRDENVPLDILRTMAVFLAVAQTRSGLFRRLRMDSKGDTRRKKKVSDFRRRGDACGKLLEVCVEKKIPLIGMIGFLQDSNQRFATEFIDSITNDESSQAAFDAQLRLAEEFGIAPKGTKPPNRVLDWVTYRLCTAFEVYTGNAQYGLVGQMVWLADLDSPKQVKYGTIYRRLARRANDRMKKTDVAMLEHTLWRQ